MASSPKGAIQTWNSRSSTSVFITVKVVPSLQNFEKEFRMKQILSLTLLMILTSLMLVSLVFAKGSPDKITIWGPPLAEPIQITNPETLNGFDPWNGQFLDRSLGTIAEEPRVQDIYNVIFYVRNNNEEIRIFYAFRYSPNPSGGQGFIYLPGEGEPWHLMNGQTIVRTSGWHYASREWDTLIQQMLEKDKGSPSGTIISRDLQTAVLIIILLGGAATIRCLRRKLPISV